MEFIKSIEATGVHGRFDLHQELQPGVNILFGTNGTGKTTLLHILANVLNGAYPRFAFLTFESVEAQLGSGKAITLRSKTKGDERVIEIYIDGRQRGSLSAKEMKLLLERPRTASDVDRLSKMQELNRWEPLLQTAYFPAFRTMIEAWASMPDERDSRVYSDTWLPDQAYYDRLRRYPDMHQVQATELARRLFGQFVPKLNYPSPMEIETRIAVEAQRAQTNVARTDRELLSQVFLDVFAAVFQHSAPPEISTSDILEEIRRLSAVLAEHPLEAKPGAETDLYVRLKKSLDSVQVNESSEQVTGVLDIYRKSLQQRAKVQEESFAGIEQYLASVNDFLGGKELTLVSSDLPVETRRLDLSTGLRLRFLDDGSLVSLRALSSGERQIVTLIYAATHMSAEKVILIDEPEISLHVDWQRRLLKTMSEQLPDRQIIACTHSPVVSADYGDRVKELLLKTSDHSVVSVEEPDSLGEEVTF